MEKLNRLTLKDFLVQREIDVDSLIVTFLRRMAEEQPLLSQVEINFISPDEEPNTGGFFDVIELGEGKFVPTIFIVTEQTNHMVALMKNRQTSIEMSASMLALSFENMTPRLLRLFIIAHELGHATDYIKNYEKYGGIQEWREHYEANLLLLPVTGLDPAELQSEISGCKSLEEFFSVFPSLRKSINLLGIKTLSELQRAQEIAYRTSPYESYADNFAAEFIKRNAVKLGLQEMLSEENKFILKRAA